eukprot:1079240-Rhodomonas_salina.1
MAAESGALRGETPFVLPPRTTGNAVPTPRTTGQSAIGLRVASRDNTAYTAVREMRVAEELGLE